MESVEHRIVELNGIKMHVAEKGEGPVVLMLHGFPELWYSWRHQILDLSSKGYRAVAPDLRGYGDTEAPESVTSYTCFHLVGDIIALIDSLGVDKVYLVGHDWGAILGWYVCLFRPERVKAYICLSVPFRPFLGRDPKEPGKMEAELAEVGAAYFLRNVITTRKLGPPIFPKGEYGTGFNPDTPDILPSWLSEQDLDYYVTKFNKTGFTGALNYYRNLQLNWELTSTWSNVAEVNVPVKFITGDFDLVYTSPGMKEYIHDGGFKKDVPGLVDVVVQKGIAHFNNQEAAQDVLASEQRFIFVTVLWSMWQSRNNKLWRNQTETTFAVYDRACTVLTEWQSAQSEQTKSINRQLQPAELKWTKPSLGRYKCNIDASFSSDLDKVGIGTCIRDDQGRFVLAKTEWFSPTCDVEMGEAQGLLHAFR
ncbi:hypothetical protein TSUD_31890 [Trifolium subterraneum]|uniref:AB hydrolase-1 domain-containing protein n=1 Tax=Trifolium subterraneum TaxID=3900 RepID=A0A2Z6MX14_TRISU|nr:hypothetical protein TSUD_31890 [Trifolium subterraneum]